MVCEECAYKLDLVYEFREKSIKTEYELKNMLKRLEEEYQTAMGDQLTITSLPVQVVDCFKYCIILNYCIENNVWIL